MPSTRVGHDEQMALALDELARLAAGLDDLSIIVTGPDQVSVHHDEAEWPARVITYDAVSEAQARHLVATAARGHKILVANRISEPARRYLASQRWAWLDRRIGAHVPIGRRDIELRYSGGGRAAVGPTAGEGAELVRVPRPAAEGPIRGRAGIAYAAALLCHPASPPSFRSVAAEVGMSPTAISNAVKHLAAAGLVGPRNEPTLPDLFWALAEVWQAQKVLAVATAPEAEARQFQTNVDQLDRPGWVLGGDLAAAELGAPLFNVEHRPWLWVPTQVELRRAERFYGRSAWEERAAVVAAPPTPLVCRWRRPARASGDWPLPHPVFAALDLARDPGRGREILAQWSPEGADVVWR
ncbi:MAG: hypothetical protein ACRDY6_16070 [Acidimicrobiia bacterium]